LTVVHNQLHKTLMISSNLLDYTATVRSLAVAFCHVPVNADPTSPLGMAALEGDGGVVRGYYDGRSGDTRRRGLRQWGEGSAELGATATLGGGGCGDGGRGRRSRERTRC
jgi:hypothetical protein